jgi:hypothetical protein
MKTNTSSLMDGKFTPPRFNAPKNEYKKSLKAGFRWVIGLLICLVLVVFYSMILRNKQIIEEKQNSPLQKQVDSLRDELFIQENNVQRYEIAIDIMKSEDSALYEKFQIYLNETE